ncbi:hypothetical protein BGZ81_009568 [Podila clonocystis]|nr:hypothetical protein BGZ81_009568 [Podila clonocystis]
MKFTLGTILGLGLVTSSMVSTMTTAYPIVDADALKCRSGPGTNFPALRQLSRGTDVQIICQTPGTNIRGDKLWIKTQFGCYVADFYVQTGTSGYVAAHCDGSSGGGGGGGSGGGGGGVACSGVNDAGFNLIKEFEGFVPRPAPDPIGLPTVGYGHLCQSRGCGEVPFSFPLSPETATELLKRDIPRYTSCLARVLNNRVILNQNQWAALTSWTFNVGCGAVASSTLVQRLNQGQNPVAVAENELPQWNRGGGRVLEGLKRRRGREVALFKEPNGQQAHPSCA